MARFLPVHQLQVVHAHVAGRAAIQRRLLGHAHQCRIAAIAGAVQADALRVGDLLFYRPARGIGEIVLHRTAPFACAGLHVRAPVIARAAEIEPEHGVAGARQHLRLVVDLPAIEDADRSAMRHHHQRQRTPAAAGARQVPMERQAIARLQRDRFAGRQRGRIQPAAPAEDQVGRVGFGVEQVEVARTGVVPDMHDLQPAVARARGDQDRMTRKRPLELAVEARRLRRFIEERRAQPVVHEEAAHRRATARGADDPVGIDDRIAEYLRALAGHRIQRHDRVRPLALLDLQVGRAAVGRKAPWHFDTLRRVLVVDQRPGSVAGGAVIELAGIVLARTQREADLARRIHDEVGAADGGRRHGVELAVVRVQGHQPRVRHRGVERVHADQHLARIVRHRVDQLGRARQRVVAIQPIATEDLPAHRAVHVRRIQFAGRIGLVA